MVCASRLPGACLEHAALILNTRFAQHFLLWPNNLKIEHNYAGGCDYSRRTGKEWQGGLCAADLRL
jgi:hypothetical protein